MYRFAQQGLDSCTVSIVQCVAAKQQRLSSQFQNTRCCKVKFVQFAVASALAHIVS